MRQTKTDKMLASLGIRRILNADEDRILRVIRHIEKTPGELAYVGNIQCNFMEENAHRECADIRGVLGSLRRRRWIKYSDADGYTLGARAVKHYTEQEANWEAIRRSNLAAR